MAAPKRAQIVEAPFRVPSLAEADGEYAALQERLHAVQTENARLQRDVDALTSDLRANPPTRHFRPGVAELLGDTIETDERPKHLVELRKRLEDAEAAVDILRKRLAERRGPASVSASEACRGEYGRRVVAVCEALKAVNAAHLQLQQLIVEFEANDLAWTRLVPMQPVFLGDPRDGHVQRYLKSAQEAGYE